MRIIQKIVEEYLKIYVILRLLAKFSTIFFDEKLV